MPHVLGVLAGVGQVVLQVLQPRLRLQSGKSGISTILANLSKPHLLLQLIYRSKKFLLDILHKKVGPHLLLGGASLTASEQALANIDLREQTFDFGDKYPDERH